MKLGKQKELRVFVCNHVYGRSKPILLISNEGGDLSFLCGGLHEEGAAEGKAVGLNHVIDTDPTVIEVLERLPAESEAERQEVGSTWLVTSIKSH